MPKNPWEKVLYKKQNYPDNYVDKTFLSDLKRNANLHNYTWREVLTGVCVVTHEIACTSLFVTTFIYLKEDIVSIPCSLVSMSLLLLLTTLLQQTISKKWWLKESFTKHAKNCVIFVLFSYMFSPILKTLTQSISTDTIYTTSGLMLLVHVFFQDYGTNVGMVSGSLSLNSALFAAVCLASRLESSQHTFAVVILAVESFVLMPLLRKKLKEDDRVLVVVTALFVLLGVVGWWVVSVVYVMMFVVVCACVNFLFPACFMYCQRFKENKLGPWDEAVVKVD